MDKSSPIHAIALISMILLIVVVIIYAYSFGVEKAEHHSVGSDAMRSLSGYWREPTDDGKSARILVLKMDSSATFGYLKDEEYHLITDCAWLSNDVSNFEMRENSNSAISNFKVIELTECFMRIEVGESVYSMMRVDGDERLEIDAVMNRVLEE